MKYTELLLLPIMMFSSYLLGVLGAIQKEKRYDLHFKAMHCELNPLWRKSIADKKWFNLKYFLGSFLISGSLIYFMEMYELPLDFSQGFIGFILTGFSAYIGRQISFLFVFSYHNRHRDEISGEVRMSHLYALYISLFQKFAVLMPVAMVAMFSESYLQSVDL